MADAAKSYVSPEEYLAAERHAEFRSEYLDGVVYAMAGESPQHNFITSNVGVALHSRLGPKNCWSFQSDMRVGSSSWPSYLYPDVVAGCGELELRDDDILLNPMVIFEVLSPRTADLDRHLKFEKYKSIPALVHYVLVEQRYCWVDLFTRREDGHWQMDSFTNLESILPIHALDCEIPLEQIYERVELGTLPTLTS